MMTIRRAEDDTTPHLRTEPTDRRQISKHETSTRSLSGPGEPEGRAGPAPIAPSERGKAGQAKRSLATGPLFGNAVAARACSYAISRRRTVRGW